MIIPRNLGILFALLMLLTGQPSPAQEAPALLQPSDLVYRGAFRFPDTSGDASRWAYGGSGLTYVPTGDQNGPEDGYPGSLYGIGHNHHQLVSEISIPVPVISPSKNAKELPTATTLQPFADVTGGLRAVVGVSNVGDIAYLEPHGHQTSEKLYWTVYEYYNAAGVDYLSHGCSDMSVKAPHAMGVWHIGPTNNREYHSMKSADYIFDIDRSWADRNIGSKYLGSGRVREAGAFGSTRGPALFAYAPYQYPASALGYGAVLEAIALLSYSKGYEYPDYKACDRWNGGAWITAGNKSAVIFAGTKSLGEVFYGKGRPGDCTPYKGYHCPPYESQIIFYDPAELAQVARNEKNPGQVVPYAVMRPAQYLWPTCSAELGGVAFDRARGLLYIVQPNVDKSQSQYEKYPLVHVFKVNGQADGRPASDGTPPAAH